MPIVIFMSEIEMGTARWHGKTYSLEQWNCFHCWECNIPFLTGMLILRALQTEVLLGGGGRLLLARELCPDTLFTSLYTRKFICHVIYVLLK